MSQDKNGFQPPETDKEVVIYRSGWGFRLPEQHEAVLSADQRHVMLSIPDSGGLYSVDRIDQTADEFRIHVGAWAAGHGPAQFLAQGALPNRRAEYPFPSVADELARLRQEWEELGGARTDFDAWAQGDSYDSKTSRVRDQLRQMRASGTTQ